MNPRDRIRHHILTLLSQEWEKHPEWTFGKVAALAVHPLKVFECSIDCLYEVDDRVTLDRLKEGLPG